MPIANRVQQQVSQRAGDDGLDAQVGEVLKAYAQPVGTAASAHVNITRQGDAYGVYLGDAPVWGTCSRDEARHLALRELIEVFAGRERVGAMLHARPERQTNRIAPLARLAASIAASSLTYALVEWACDRCEKL